jgi:replicative superfamily II helicase
VIEDKSNFIQWLINRLVYKHSYAKNDNVISSLYELKDYYSRFSGVKISDTDLDKIISKYYIDFHFEKTEDFKVGFTEGERNILRTTIRSIINDILGTIK